MKYFAAQGINLHICNDEDIDLALEYYDFYLRYVSNLATVQKMLSDRLLLSYSIAVVYHLPTVMSATTLNIDFYDKFAINCLSYFLRFLCKVPLEHMHYEDTHKDFYKHIIPLVNYFTLVNKKKAKDEVCFQLALHLLPQCRDRFAEFREFADLLEQLHSFGEGTLEESVSHPVLYKLMRVAMTVAHVKFSNYFSRYELDISKRAHLRGPPNSKDGKIMLRWVGVNAGSRRFTIF